MDFKLDYDQLVILDAEDLAETGIGNAYQALLPTLRQYVSQPADIEEIIDEDAPSYAVRHGGQTYSIYSPELDEGEGQSWGRAAHAFFSIVNTQLMQSEYRFYAINGGNDLGGMFLKPAECEAAKRSLTGKNDWPYFPTLEHPWYGQHHD